MCLGHGGKSDLRLTILRLLWPNCLQRVDPKTVQSIMKTFCSIGIIFGALAVLLFGLDLAIQIPFGRPSWTLNIGFIITGILLVYMGWTTQKEMH